MDMNTAIAPCWLAFHPGTQRQRQKA